MLWLSCFPLYACKLLCALSMLFLEARIHGHRGAGNSKLLCWRANAIYLVVLLTYGGLVAADVQPYCPAKGVCYSVGIPSKSATSGTGNIYLQISGPLSYSWIALGTGIKMAGSNMFVNYPDGNGNVTLSARLGLDHDEPQQDTGSSAARLTLLAGSGVDADVMRANIVCANCEQWANGGTMKLNSTTPWIAAWRTSGSSPQTTDANANIAQHDDTSQWEFDLTKALVTTDINPFIGLDTNATANSSNGVISGDDSQSLDHAHAAIMGLAFFGLYPLGALLMPLVGNWKLHAIFQVSVLALTWVGFGLGYALSEKTQDVRKGPSSFWPFDCVLMILAAFLE